MAWSSSDRKAYLPSNWQTLRRQRFEIDSWACVDCGHHDPTGGSLECDHSGERTDHRIEQLRTRCGPKGNDCHGKRTKIQAAAARAQRQPTNRPTGKHPGLL